MVSVQFQDGKMTLTRVHNHDTLQKSGNINPIFDHGLNNTSTGMQRTFVVDGAITLIINTIQPSCGYSNGAIIVTASGGTGPYSYSIDPGWYYKTGYFPFLVAGNYTVVVTDATGQTAIQNIVLTNTLPPPKLTVASVTRSSGCVASDASVVLAASGGAPPYEYSIDLVNYQTSNTFSNLPYGLYNFYVRDANGCIARYNGFNILFDLSPGGCDNGFGFSYSETECNNDGFIDASNSSTSASFVYSLDGINFQPIGVWNNLGYGVYNLYYKNIYTGQVNLFAISISHNCYIKLDYISVDAACEQNDGSLIVTASNGTAPYTYTIDGMNYQSSNIFTGLGAGNYSVTVRDANGFTSSRGAVVYDRCPALSLSSTDEGCAANDGTITATATKGTAPYQYSRDGINFSSNNVFTGLAAGSYTITLKDNLGFTCTASININYSCVSVTAFTVDEICGQKNGSITAMATNGNPPYQFSIDGINFTSNNVFTGLIAGNYIITVKDFSGQTGTATVAIADIQGAQVTAGVTPASCENDDGSITISGTSGKIPYQYSIDGTNFQSGNFFANLPSGAYTVYIKDGNACVTSKQITVLQNCPAVVATVTDETCNGSNGIINVSGTSGTSPYQFSIDGINFQTNTQFTGIKAGTYTITIKDAAGVINTTSVIIMNICPTVSVAVTDGLCSIANGIITATGMNGTGPYQYSIDGINFQAGNIFSNLASATYTVYVKDANGLNNMTNAVVNNFPGPTGTVSSSDASCFANDGKVNIVAVGGSAPLQYSLDWVNFSGSNQFTGVAPGNYNATIKDVNGCIATLPVTVSLNKNITLDAGPDVMICEGTTTTLHAVSNGSSFQWTPSASVNNSLLLNPLVSPITTTKYYITAQLGVCFLTDSVVVNVNTAPIPVAQQSTTICYGQNAQLFGSGGATYNWTPSIYLNSNTIANPIAVQPKNSVTYNLSVRDGNGCQSLSDATVTITVTPPSKVFAGNDTSIVMNQPFQLMANDVNSSGFVQYVWSPSSGLNNAFIQNPVAVIDKNAIFTVTAMTAAGCQGSDDINIKVYKEANIFVPTAFTPNHDRKNDILKAIPVGIESFKYFIIYNRWGERIFYTTNSDTGWDGKYRGIDQQSGVFIWLTEGIDFKGQTIQRKGTTVLIR